ncbi:MAG: hypothetical protein ACP5MG_10675 [Verrucomicrobiia bacterium]
MVFGIFNFGFAETNANKYSAIPQRNAFNLREPEPPKPPEQPPPPITVKLTGITTLLDTKRVFLLVQEQGKQPESKMLREGEKDGAVEVVQIDEAAGMVKIINSGKEMTLTFEKDGIKPPTAPAVTTPPMPPNVPPVPGAIPLPGAVHVGGPVPFTISNSPVPGVNISVQGNTIYPNALSAPANQPNAPEGGKGKKGEEKPPKPPKPVRLPGSAY